MDTRRPLIRSLLLAAVLGVFSGPMVLADPAPQPLGQPPAPPIGPTASDVKWSGSDKVRVTWTHSPDTEHERVEAYLVYKAVSRVGEIDLDPLEFQIVDLVPSTETSLRVDELFDRVTRRDLRLGQHVSLIDLTDEQLLAITEESLPVEWVFEVVAISPEGVASEPARTAEPITPSTSWFDGSRGWLAVIVIVFGGSVIFFIQLAKAGKPLKVRKIAGLSAVDEAVGRATEMGRSIIFVPGILDMNDIQTIAGITILSRVARTAAEYDAKVEVPTARSLVMTSARETVQAAFLSAGRPDAYNQDLIYYVTDEQFGYVAHLQGTMSREKPAACFYMGAFFAESLILAETGNNIGAIQIAGTAMPAQLPFFVAACDYTLIGEEFFAASAYLSGDPDQIGSLKGQDVGKVIVAIGIVIGVGFATLAEITGSEWFETAVAYIRDNMLT